MKKQILPFIGGWVIGVALFVAAWPLIAQVFKLHVCDAVMGYSANVAGGLLGGGMTLIAAIVAFGLTQQQVQMQAEELHVMKAERSDRAKAVATILMRSVAIARAEAENNLTEIATNADLIDPSSMFQIKTIEAAMGFGELWRMGDEIVVTTLDLDILIVGFNGFINHPPGSRLVMRERAVTILEGIKDYATEIVEKSSTELLDHAAALGKSGRPSLFDTI